MNKFFLFFIFFLWPANVLLADLIAVDTISPAYESGSYNFNAIAVSHLDKIYLSETINHELYELTRNGEIIKKTGGFGWNENNFNYPTDIAINAGLNIFVTDKNNHRLLRFDKNIHYITAFPDANSHFYLQYPIALEISKDGELFILQENNFEILVIDSDRRNYRAIGSDVAENFRLISPVDIHFTGDEELLVLEQNGKILSFDRYGSPLQIHSKSNSEQSLYKIVKFANAIYALSTENQLLKLSNRKFTKTAVVSGTGITDIYTTHDRLYLLSESGIIYIFASQN